MALLGNEESQIELDFVLPPKVYRLAFGGNIFFECDKVFYVYRL